MILAIGGIGCEQVPGEGGTSTLTGKVWARDLNNSGQLIAEYYAPEERVYIIYGEDSFYHDDVRTDYQGRYAFRYLKKGRYTVFAYSRCDTCAAGTQAVFLHADITRNGSVVELPDLIIYK